MTHSISFLPHLTVCRMLHRALGGRGESYGKDVEGDKDALVLQEDNLGAKEVVTKEKDGKCCRSQEKNKTHPEDLLSLNAPEKKKIGVSNERQEAKISTARYSKHLHNKASV